MGDDLKEKAAAALRTGRARASVISYHTQEKMGTLAHYAEVTGRRSIVVADRYGRRVAQQAVVVGRRINEEYGPAVKGYGHRLSVKYGIDEKFALRPLDGADSLSEALGPECEMLLQQVQEMPTSAAPLAALVALRGLKGVHVVVSEVIRQWLSSRTKFARLSILLAVSPGWAALFLYRRALLVSRPLPKATDGPEERTLQLVRDARRLPPVFWLSATISATVTLQVLSQVSTAVVRRAFQVRKRTLVAAAMVYVLAQHHGQRGAAILESVRSRLHPDTVAKLEHNWKLFHAVVSAWARLLVPSAPAPHGGGAKFAGRGSIDQEAIDGLLADGGLTAPTGGSTAEADEERN